MRDQLPPISKLAMRVAAALEEAVAHFAVKHRHGAGADLRTAAREVVRCAGKAWRERDLQLKVQAVHALSVAVDDLKIEMNIAALVKAWRSLGELEAIARLVRDLGRQVGGWQKDLDRKGQNARAARLGQRAQTLSAHHASHEARA